jgi:hypothetical protein
MQQAPSLCLDSTGRWRLKAIAKLVKRLSENARMHWAAVHAGGAFILLYIAEAVISLRAGFVVTPSPSGFPSDAIVRPFRALLVEKNDE